MKIECVLDKLKLFLPVIERITGKNLTLNILSSVLLIANGKTLKLRSTNLDIGIEVEIPVKIYKEGIVAVRGSVLNDLFLNIQDENSVLLEVISDNITITTPNNIATVKCSPHTDFPTIPLISGDFQFLLDCRKFINGVKAVAYSSSLSDIKPEISSVYIYPHEDELVFVATDSFRLAEKKIKVKNIPDFHGVLIPYKNIIEIIRVIELSDSDIKICFNKNQISFSYDGVYLTSRLIDGTFPDYKQIIPKEIVSETILLKQDLVNALKVNNIFLDKFNQVTLALSPKRKKFSISTKSGEVGEVKTTLSATMKGEDVESHLNYRYLFDVFQSISSDSVSLSFSGNTKPVVVKGVPDQSFMYLVMPLNR